jgi:predicted nucleic acid-binding protein
VALIVLDASVVIAHIERSDALNAVAVAALRDRHGDDLRIPASAYAEALVGPARANVLEAASQGIAHFAAVQSLDAEVAETAAALRAAAPGLRIADALVLGTGYAIGADEILTTDQRWARYNRVTVLG